MKFTRRIKVKMSWLQFVLDIIQIWEKNRKKKEKKNLVIAILLLKKLLNY